MIDRHSMIMGWMSSGFPLSFQGLPHRWHIERLLILQSLSAVGHCSLFLRATSCLQTPACEDRGASWKCCLQVCSMLQVSPCLIPVILQFSQLWTPADSSNTVSSFSYKNFWCLAKHVTSHSKYCLCSRVQLVSKVCATLGRGHASLYFFLCHPLLKCSFSNCDLILGSLLQLCQQGSIPREARWSPGEDLANMLAQDAHCQTWQAGTMSDSVGVSLPLSWASLGMGAGESANRLSRFGKIGDGSSKYCKTF